MNFDSYVSRLETILSREIALGARYLEISGSPSLLPLGLLLSEPKTKEIAGLPHVVVTSSFADANQLQRAIATFNPSANIYVLPENDVSHYSGLQLKRGLSAERIRFLAAAQSAGPGDVFIGSLQSWLQKTVPYQALARSIRKFRINSDLPENIKDLLHGLGYQSTPIVEDVGQYSIRGGIVDIFSPAHPRPVRIELFGDTVSDLRFFSAADQRSLGP